MNDRQIQLYQRIQNYDLDDRHAKFPFSQKLAKENRWSAEYTQRAIAEYKKFVFLAVVAGHSVTPSEQVDRVWHLHLLYTRSYWDDFCKNVLQIPLHHNPTLGGSSERSKFYNQYDRTLSSYESFFGESPPTDIWSPVNIRFGRDTHAVVVNTAQNWIIPKPNLDWLPKFSVNRSILLFLFFGLALMVTGCKSLLSNPNNPLNFKGPYFLVFYICLASIAVLLGCTLRHFLQKNDRRLSEDSIALDAYETAYLASKDQRTIETAVLSLVKRGHLRPQPTTRTLEIIESLPDNSHPLERAIEVQLRQSSEFNRIRDLVAVKREIDSIRDRLSSLDVLFNSERSLLIQRLSALPIFLVLLLGITKIGVGLWRGKPVGVLVNLCILTAIIGYGFLCMPIGNQHRSLYGDRILTHLERQNQHYLNRWSHNPQELAFALFGIVVLSENALQGLRQVFSPLPPPRVVSTPPSRSTRSSGDGGGGGGDGGCGGGGCGGGGCGGCGDCGD